MEFLYLFLRYSYAVWRDLVQQLDNSLLLSSKKNNKTINKHRGKNENIVVENQQRNHTKTNAINSGFHMISLIDFLRL